MRPWYQQSYNQFYPGEEISDQIPACGPSYISTGCVQQTTKMFEQQNQQSPSQVSKEVWEAQQRAYRPSNVPPFDPNNPFSYVKPATVSIQEPKDELLKMRHSPTNNPDIYASPTVDAEAIKKAFDGIGCDSHAINNIICKRTPLHLKNVNEEYARLFQKPLWKRVKDELSNPHEHVITAILHYGISIDAYFILYSTKFMYIDIDTIMLVLITKTDEEMDALKQCYKSKYSTHLLDTFYSRTSGWHRDAMAALLDMKIYKDIDQETAKRHAAQLMIPGEMTKPIADLMINIFCKSSHVSIFKVLKELKKISSRSLAESLDQSKLFEKLIAYIASYVEDPAKFYANYLYEGISKKNIYKIITVVALHYHSFMGNILDAYHAIYQRELLADISNNFSSDKRTYEALTMLLTKN